LHAIGGGGTLLFHLLHALVSCRQALFDIFQAFLNARR
jgi:hypothetical protein